MNKGEGRKGTRERGKGYLFWRKKDCLWIEETWHTGKWQSIKVKEDVSVYCETLKATSSNGSQWLGMSRWVPRTARQSVNRCIHQTC